MTTAYLRNWDQLLAQIAALTARVAYLESLLPKKEDQDK